jgi:hypothetical protein
VALPEKADVKFLIYFHMVVEYSFTGDAFRVGLNMTAKGKLARPAAELIFKSNITSQYFVKIGDREISYLRRGLDQPGGKLPLFDLDGQEFESAVIRRCIERGWAEPWFRNPLKPDWLVCKLTLSGRAVVERALDLKSRLPARKAS